MNRPTPPIRSRSPTMTGTDAESRSPAPSRRDFLRTSAAAAGAGVLGSLGIQRAAHAAGSGTIKIGLIGCGGRGSGAAANAMNAGDDVRLVAMADIFADRVEGAAKRLKQLKPRAGRCRRRTACFVGFDAYEKLIQSGVDVVLIAAASHFHPQHLQGGRRRRQARLLRETPRPGRAGPQDRHGGGRGGQAKEARAWSPGCAGVTTRACARP